jgi:mRNA interferase RelE/StbE
MILTQVREAIDLAELAENLQQITHLKKLRGGENYYRIKLGDYRIGVIVENEVITFVRFLHRKDIYRYFP